MKKKKKKKKEATHILLKTVVPNSLNVIAFLHHNPDVACIFTDPNNTFQVDQSALLIRSSPELQLVSMVVDRAI